MNDLMEKFCFWHHAKSAKFAKFLSGLRGLGEHCVRIKLAFALLCVFSSVVATATPRRLFSETPAQKAERLSWWTHDRFGMFIHFGLYSIPARGEWIKKIETIPEAKYDEYFNEMYKADPMNFDRVWKGRNDLTASVKIDFDGPDLRIVANVRDEQLADGDCLFVIVDGVGKRFAPDCLIEMGARYVGKIACPKPESVMEIRVEDDDGCGKEGWVTTGQFRVTRN